MQVLSNGRCKRTENEWRQIQARFRKSGQSGRDFCRKEGLHLASFHRWRRRLDGSPAAGDFVTVTATPAASPTWTLEVILPDIGTLRFQGRA
jgi:hypothetical protein